MFWSREIDNTPAIVSGTLCRRGTIGCAGTGSPQTCDSKPVGTRSDRRKSVGISVGERQGTLSVPDHPGRGRDYLVPHSGGSVGHISSPQTDYRAAIPSVGRR